MMQFNFDYTNHKMRQETERRCSFSRHINNLLTCQAYPNGYVVPHWGDGIPASWESGGVLTQDLDHVLDSVFIDTEFSVRGIGTKGIVKRPETVIYIGSFHPMYGHVITDGLKLLWFLYTPEGKALIEKGARLVYTTIFHADLPRWTQEVLELAGVDLSITERITTTTQFAQVYVPNTSITESGGERYYTDSYLQVINHMKRGIQPLDGYDKLYFTRSRFKQKNKDGNGEKQIELLFQKNGYRVIAPEEFTVREQIAMLMSCRCFATTEGSISHNSVFCNPGTDCYILRKVNFFNAYQLMVNDAAKTNLTYIDAHHSTMASRVTPWFGPFYLCVTPEVRRFFSIKAFTLPICLHPSWIIYIIKNTLRKLKRKL